MEILSALAVALALGIDGLAVGAAYGMRRIRVPLRSLLVIGLCSALCFALAMFAGQALAAVSGPRGPRTVGAVILVGLGVWNIVKALTETRAGNRGGASETGGLTPGGEGIPFSETASAPETAAAATSGAVRDGETVQGGGSAAAPLFCVRLPGPGLVVQVLREPGRADADGSGTIDTGEAVVLGAALGLDALAAGFGAAFIGFGGYAVALVAGAQVLLTWLGLRLGRGYGARLLGEKASYAPGAILILIGLLQL